MGLSNAAGHLVLTTGNKSEIATGYSTLYGDSAGGFGPIKDVPKTLVWDLARWRNAEAAGRGETPPIPENSITKPPSAELAPGQLDTDSLPDYPVLDAILDDYVEKDMGAAELIAAGHDPALVDRVIQLVDRAEYKRRQYPPGPKITPRNFGRDRRLPITNRWREPAGPAPGSTRLHANPARLAPTQRALGPGPLRLAQHQHGVTGEPVLDLVVTAQRRTAAPPWRAAAAAPARARSAGRRRAVAGDLPPAPGPAGVQAVQVPGRASAAASPLRIPVRVTARRRGEQAWRAGPTRCPAGTWTASRRTRPAGRIRAISSASVRAGDRKSSPDGSQSAGYIVSALNQARARATIASRSAGSPGAGPGLREGPGQGQPNALPRSRAVADRVGLPGQPAEEAAGPAPRPAGSWRPPTSCRPGDPRSAISWTSASAQPQPCGRSARPVRADELGLGGQRHRGELGAERGPDLLGGHHVRHASAAAAATSSASAPTSASRSCRRTPGVRTRGR